MRPITETLIHQVGTEVLTHQLGEVVITNHKQGRSNTEKVAVSDELISVWPISDKTPRAFTTDEARDKFLDAFWGNLDYWHNNVPSRSVFDAMTGLMHSTLALLDGCNMSVPGFQLIPYAADEDKQYLIDQGENYYTPVEHNILDIGGYLHELMYSHMPAHLRAFGIC